MIIERAQIDVHPGREAEFEAALAEARDEALSRAKGFRSLRAGRGIETPNRYLLLLEWDTLEDHTVGFRESELFLRWRQLIGPFFASAPDVEHFAPV
jgi:heme-degrading monooxygenase HmoA